VRISVPLYSYVSSLDLTQKKHTFLVMAVLDPVGYEGPATAVVECRIATI
jgi:hypothetical protein